MEFSRKKNFFVLFVISLPFLVYLCFVPIWPEIFDFANAVKTNYQSLTDRLDTREFVYKTAALTNSTDTINLQNLPQKLQNPPAILKVAYATGWSAGSKNYLTYLDNLFATTQINAMVIDVKDSSGIVSYATGAKSAKSYHAYHPEISDIDTLVKTLHEKGIYVIGRIAVFEDPVLAKQRPDLAISDSKESDEAGQPVPWKNSGGISWMDPASQEVWDYNIEIAKDALLHGFDEINFDYVRFPTDGNMENMGFPVWDSDIPKNIVIKNFFKYVRDALPNETLSVDIFGQTTTNTDDMGIGQIFEDSLAYFDYVCPMVYPSHYANGFLGYKNPADHPYELVNYAISKAVDRSRVYKVTNAASQTPLRAKIRPWLQDFSLGAIYNAPMIKQEIKAVNDATKTDFSGYMLWSPSNIYTSQAILK